MRHRSVLLLILAAALVGGCAGWGVFPWDRDAVEAARSGDVEGLQQAFDEGAGPGSTDRAGRPLLQHATVQGHAEILQWLLEAGADPDQTGPAGRTALHYAASAPEADAARILLRAGADPNLQDEDGRTPLMEAAARGYYDRIEDLLSYCADPDLRAGNGHTALSAAAAGRHQRSVEVLLEASEQVAAPGAVVDVVRAGDVQTLRWMLDRGLDAEARWEDEDGRTQTLLDAAVRYSPRAAAALIRGAGVSVGDPGRALVVFAMHGDPEKVRQLLAAGADPDASVDGGDAGGRTALMEAARLGHGAVMEVLLEAGADPAVRDEHGATALWHAAVGYWSRLDSMAGLERSSDRDAAVQTLLDAGVEPDSGDVHDFAPIHAVAAWGRGETLSAMMDAGDSVQRADRNGRTPLAYAAQYDNDETVDVLLAHRADPQSVDRLGVRPVAHAHLAARRGIPAMEAVEGAAAGSGRPGSLPGPEPRGTGRVAERFGDMGLGGRRVVVGSDTPPLAVEVRERRIMELDRPLPIYDTLGYDSGARLLPYTTACVDHACRVPPVLILPAGTVVELIHRTVGGDGRLHGTFLIQEPGLEGVLFEDWVHGAWPPAGHGETQLTIGRVAHIRRMPWVEAYGVDLREASGGVIW